MANRTAVVKQAEVTRYVKGTIAAGVPVGKVVVAPDGTVTIFPAGAAADDGPNPFDERLK